METMCILAELLSFHLFHNETMENIWKTEDTSIFRDIRAWNEKKKDGKGWKMHEKRELNKGEVQTPKNEEGE